MKKKYIYFKIPLEEFVEIIQEHKDITPRDLLRYRKYYCSDVESKRNSALRASVGKKFKIDRKILQLLKKCYTGLFKSVECDNLNPHKLSKLAKINYRTAKRFWQEYNMDYWIKKFDNKITRIDALKEFELKYFKSLDYKIKEMF